MICMVEMPSHQRFQSLILYKHLGLYHLSSVNLHVGWGEHKKKFPSPFPRHLNNSLFVSLLALLSIIRLQPQSQGCALRNAISLDVALTMSGPLSKQMKLLKGILVS